MYTYLVEWVGHAGVPNSKAFVQTFLCFATMFLSATLWSKRSKWWRTVEMVNRLPGPKHSRIFGNLADFYHLASNPERYLLGWLHNLAKEHGPIYRIWMLNHPVVVVTDTEVAMKLYNRDCLMEKSTYVSDAAKAIGGVGLLALPASVHSVRRKQWMPSFTRKQVENSVKFFRQQSLRLCDELGDFEKSGQEFDFLGMSISCTFRAICYSAFGEEYMNKLPESVGRDHMYDLHTVSLNMTSRVFRPWVANDLFYFYATEEGRKTMKSVKRGNSLPKKALQHRRRHRKASIVTSTKERVDSDEFECFLDNMLELLNAGHLTENEVIQELNVFIAAGYDTSGVTICYVLYFLSLYPEHQQKIVDDLCEVIPPEKWADMSTFSITAATTKQMKYLEMCIRETLRLYPVLPISPRRTAKNVELQNGMIIPAEVDVLVMLDVTHRDPKYFPEPDKFLPERHLQPNPAYMPFTLGSRNCIGQVYAMYEMKVILAYLLMTYRWETSEKENFKPIFQTLQVPEKGMHFRITKREF